MRMFPQRIWHNSTACSPAFPSTMYHPSPSISLQPELQEQSALKTPTLQLLLSDVTAPSSGHMHTAHDMSQVLHPSEWDFGQQLPASIPPHASQIDVDLPHAGWFLEQHMAAADYLSSLLPCANEQASPESNFSAPLKRAASIRLASQGEASQCELSQLALPPYNGSPAAAAATRLEPISACTPVSTAQNESAGWTSVPIRQTVIPSSYVPQRAANSTPNSVNDMASVDMRPKLRFSKGASASKYCHICGRNSKTVAVAQCANVTIGLCRKVVCEKCLMLYRNEIGARCSTPSESWKCTHCEGVCPKRARCHQYTKNNLRRRMKSDSKQRKKLQELRRRRGELGVEERARELMQLTRKAPCYKV